VPKQPGSLPLLAKQIGILLRPLEQSLSASQVTRLFAVLGQRFPPELVETAAFKSALEQGAAAAGQLRSLIAQLSEAIDSDDVVLAVQKTGKILSQIRVIADALEAIAEQLKIWSAAHPDGTQAIDFAESLAARLIEYLTIRYIDNYIIHAEILELLGILERTSILFEPEDPAQGSFVREQLHLNRIVDLLTKPLEHARAMYGWGEASFDGARLLERVNNVLTQWMLEGRMVPGTSPLLESFLFDLRQTSETTPPGLELKLKLPIVAGLDLSFPISKTFSANVSSTGRFDPDLRVLINPPATVSILPPTGTLDGDFQFRLIGKNVDPAEPFVILGAAEGSRLEATSVEVGFGLEATWDSQQGRALGQFKADADIHGGRIVFDTSKGDGFLSKIFSNQTLMADFQIGATWTPQEGFHFKGSAGFELVLPINRSIGPIDFQRIYLGLQLNNDGIPLEISGAFSAQLGPLIVTVDRLGLEARFALPEQGGNLGPVDFDIGFKPPTAIGLAIDTQGISGGGFLRIDPPNYAGLLALTFQDEIELTAFGLITTRLPDGKPGFSLVISILAEFQPLQLGLGFALDGVGGLIGINRQFNEEGLRTAFKTHALDDVLFPASPIKDAVKLFDTLQSILPPREGYHVIGPMARLFWGGTLRLVNFEIGIFMQLGGARKVVLLGQAWSRLPREEAALLVINVDVLGIIDFGEERVAFDATLFDSRIMDIHLDGQMALRADWSAGEENFAMSVGGFHPQFQQIPAGFPELRRLALVMGENPRLSLTMYLAITTNTLQVGAKLELWAKKLGFTITGGASFDALFTFSPFSFLVTLKVWVNVKRGWIDLGLYLELELTGPNPLVAAGYVKIKLGWFFSVKVRFRAEFGQKIAEPLPAVSPLAVLKQELQQARAIRAQLPGWASGYVAFTAAAEQKIDPLADLQVVQNAVPLNYTMDKFGGGLPLAAERRLRFTAGLTSEQSVTRLFAGEQFKNWTVEERLGAKPFEQCEAGIGFSGSYVLPEAHQEERKIVFETVLRESKEYLESLPMKDFRKVAIRTACVWQPQVAEIVLLQNWSQFGTATYYRPRRVQRDEANPNYVKVLDVNLSLEFSTQ
jgi:hypothetical protein